MSEHDDGGAAFPCLDDCCGNLFLVESGMTLRDHFAGQALAGDPDIYRDIKERLNDTMSPAEVRREIDLGMKRSAMCYYEIADAMLKERKEGEPEPTPEG